MKMTKSIAKLFLWSFLFPVISVFILHIFHVTFPNYIQSYGDIVPDISQNVNETSKWKILLNTCLISPLIEESVFRGNISRNIKFHYIAIGFSLVFLGLTLMNSDYINGYYFIIYSILIYFFFKLNRDNIPLNRLLIISSIAFGFLHIYKLDNSLLLNSFSYFVYTIPLIIFGYILGIVRIRYGLIYSIVFHFLKNLLAMSFVLLN